MNPLLAAIDHPDFRQGEEDFAEVLANGTLFPSLLQIVESGTVQDMKRAGVQVELLVLLQLAPANEGEKRILALARSASGAGEGRTLEAAWGARPAFDPGRLRQRLDEIRARTGNRAVTAPSGPPLFEIESSRW